MCRGEDAAPRAHREEHLEGPRRDFPRPPAAAEEGEGVLRRPRGDPPRRKEAKGLQQELRDSPGVHLLRLPTQSSVDRLVFTSASLSFSAGVGETATSGRS